MRFFGALASLCLFSWLGYMVLTDGFPDDEGGSSKTRALKVAVATATENYGPRNTGLGLFAAGALLSFLVIAIGNRAQD